MEVGLITITLNNDKSNERIAVILYAGYYDKKSIFAKSPRKDIEDYCYKYDKIISENLLVPGIIGKSCKFGNLKEYIVYNKEEMNNITLSNRQNANDLTVMKKKFDTHTTQSLTFNEVTFLSEK